MNYPIENSDLKNGLATDDEQATLIVVEALLTGTYSDIELEDETQRDAIENKVQNWSGFEQFSTMITSQKSLLNSPFAEDFASNDFLVIDDESDAKAKEVASRANHSVRSTQKNNLRIRLFSGVAAAAVIAFLFVGVTATLSNRNSGTKSSAERSSVDISPTTSSESTVTESNSKSLGDQPTAGSYTNSARGLSDESNGESSVPTETQNTTKISENNTQNASSEGKSNEIGVIQILAAFVIAALLFWLATSFLKRRKNRSPS